MTLGLPPRPDPFTIHIISPQPRSEQNLVYPPSQASIPRITVYTTLPPVLVLVIIRLWSRWRTRQLGVDDYLCLFGAAISITLCGFMLAQYSNDVYDRHSSDVPISAIAHSQYDEFQIAVIVT
ncbi:hypothetical protein F4808DRAFT_327396 [Astrocystis sublimbata]|nr:hypothetical protein F4808DRAFT_327396 [Astrocystis sublimbata]